MGIEGCSQSIIFVSQPTNKTYPITGKQQGSPPPRISGRPAAGFTRPQCRTRWRTLGRRRWADEGGIDRRRRIWRQLDAAARRAEARITTTVPARRRVGRPATLIRTAPPPTPHAEGRRATHHHSMALVAAPHACVLLPALLLVLQLHAPSRNCMTAVRDTGEKDRLLQTPPPVTGWFRSRDYAERASWRVHHAARPANTSQPSRIAGGVTCRPARSPCSSPASGGTRDVVRIHPDLHTSSCSTTCMLCRLHPTSHKHGRMGHPGTSGSFLSAAQGFHRHPFTFLPLAFLWTPNLSCAVAPVQQRLTARRAA